MNKLTRFFIGLCFALTFTTQAKAQQGFHLGINLSPGMTYIAPQHTYGNAEFDAKPMFGWTAGAQIGYKFSHHIGLFTELNYASMGGKWEGRDQNIFFTREVEMSSWQIPIMIKYTSKGKSRFFAMSGIQFNLLQKATQSYSPTYTITDSPGYALAQQGDISDLFVQNTIAFVGAFGTDIVLSDRLYLSVGLKGSMSLEDLNEEATHSLIRPDKEYDKSINYFGGIQVGIKYVIPTKS